MISDLVFVFFFVFLFFILCFVFDKFVFEVSLEGQCIFFVVVCFKLEVLYCDDEDDGSSCSRCFVCVCGRMKCNIGCLQRMGRKLIVGLLLEVLLKLLDVECEENEKKLIKYKELVWKCVYYLMVELFVLVVMYNEFWFMQMKMFYFGLGD